jgi:myo-inositol-1(or 4)-monophosphatase
MNMPDITDKMLLKVAVEAARTGGLHAQSNSSRRTEVIETYAHDVKLALDVECQSLIEKVIRTHFPQHRILGEEDDTTVNGVTLGENKSRESGAADNSYEWIVDPIDGTVNFSHGYPGWCCSIAVRRGGEVRAAAVYAPDMDALYTATFDTPAACNGKPIKVSDKKTLAECLVMTGIDKKLIPGIEPLNFFRKIAFACQKTRVMGSAALDLCWVAEGRADGYFEGSIYLWDIAAAGLIVKQAGGAGEIAALREEPNQMSYIASNGYVQKELKSLIGEL